MPCIVLHCHGLYEDASIVTSVGSHTCDYLTECAATLAAGLVFLAIRGNFMGHRALPQPVALVVEDDYMVREVLTSVLFDFGFAIVSASDGEGALALVRGRQVDVAIIDLRLPGRIEGEALSKTIQAAGAGTVVTSGDHERLMSARENGVGHVCVAKPFRLYELLKCIQYAQSQKAVIED